MQVSRRWFPLSASALRAALLSLGILMFATPVSAEDVSDKYTDENYVPEVSTAEMTSRLETTAAALAEATGIVSRRDDHVHPVTTTSWFLDEAATIEGGRVLPGAPFVRLGTDGALTEVRLTGWQLQEVPRVLYAAAGERVLLATLGEEAQAQRILGTPVTLPATEQVWVPVEVQGWIATAELTSATDTLWAHADALYIAHCAQCHAAPHLDEFDANQWSGQFDAMLDQTTLARQDARLVKTYLQLHAARPDATVPEGTVAMGGLLYTQLCASCHGDSATAGASGDIRSTGLGMLRSVAGGFESMPAIVMTDGEMEAIVAYLAHLREGP